MSVFDYMEYDRFLRDTFDSDGGEGRKMRAAEYLGVHPSRLSRILKGIQHPTQEQAFLLADFISLGPLETSYFISLVDLSRAAKPIFQNYIKKRLSDIKEGKPVLMQMTPLDGELSPSDESVLHSDPLYYLIWHGCAIRGQNSYEALAKRYAIRPELVRELVQFLCRIGLCQEEKGRVAPAVRRLEVARDSRQMGRYLSNWRTEAIRKISAPGNQDFFYSAPMSVGRSAYLQIKDLLKKVCDSSQSILATQPSETVACLNLDFFELGESQAPASYEGRGLDC